MKVVRKVDHRSIRLIGFFLLGLFALLAPPGIAADAPKFVGSQACATCHAAQTEAWAGSHHSWALREPTAGSVLGDFDNAAFEHKGITSRFFRKNDRYFVETDGAAGKPTTLEIRYVVGVEPLQQYLVELEGGRLQALDIAWDTAAKRWYHLYPDQDASAGNGLHWTGFYKNWQARCAVCHQTDFRKNYDARTHSYQSSWSELAVGCEACHGPGEAHVAWASKPAGYDAGRGDGLAPHGLLSPKGDRQTAEKNMCGPCHARREALDPDSTLPTTQFAEHYALSTLDHGLYFADGQQDAEVYILGSFLQSKMHEKGVRCSNCHDAHSGKLVAEGNAVCTQCHNATGRSDFPSLVLKDFDSPDHHHHAEGSAGAQCVNCHMPERDYMIVDGRRDHFFRVPDPLLSEKAGSPDACLSCHTGEAASWAAAAIDKWGSQRPVAGPAYAELFSATRREGLDQPRLADLAKLARDASQPAVVRASALREIGDQADPATVQSLAGLLADKSDMIRATAIRLWRSASAADRIAQLSPLLSDPVRSVRIAAALELASIPPEHVATDRRAALQAALDELKLSLAAKADFPEGQMAIGGLAMAVRNWEAAQAAFAEAVFMDPQLVQAWIARARIAEALGDPVEAAAILSAGRGKNPDDLEIASRLAPLLVQQGRQAEAVPVLRDVVKADTGNQDMRILLTLALLQSGDLTATAAELGVLRAATPERAEVLVLQALWELASGDAVGARETVGEIRRRHPELGLPPPLEALSLVP
ncbi:tetratricopeptide repeat protein [Sinorhizobium terangae]|uniref:tetratricopeptide repeat protein n=1 Tax=Sinorhizobium terangae TaxID=110322 RepID=UPI0024B1C28B|nr:tetratricopeptide repeat protein [Sinorhizobium terangae]WFU51144.1 tetratricopeptide repeat protein [Sinorhizobium terangae]